MQLAIERRLLVRLYICDQIDYEEFCPSWPSRLRPTPIEVASVSHQRRGRPQAALDWTGLVSTCTVAAADLFAGRHLGVILGAAQGGGGLGGFIGPFLGGWLFDVTSSYQIAFAAAALAIAASAVAAWVAAPRSARVTGRAGRRAAP